MIRGTVGLYLLGRVSPFGTVGYDLLGLRGGFSKPLRGQVAPGTGGPKPCDACGLVPPLGASVAGHANQ